MKIFTNKRDSIVLKLSPIAAGCAVLLSTSGAVYAQTAPAADAAAPAQEVRVVGIRKGIEAAISIKQNNSSIVEAISAEDIGKLPDTTIAESLARLPGLTTERTPTGTASTISIRGLGPDFTGSLLNNREQSSTGDSRGADLSAYPAELIGSVTVYKTPDATIAAQGLAGTIDQSLINPLDFPGRAIVAKVQSTKTGVGTSAQGKGKRYALSYIDQFADRKLGFAIGYVRENSSGTQFISDGWGGDATYNGGTVTIKGVQSNPSYRSNTNTYTKSGVASILAYKPSKDFLSQLDVFYSKNDNYFKIDRIVAPGGIAGSNNVLSNATISNGIATKGTISNVDWMVYNEGTSTADVLKSIGWKNTLSLGGGWKGVLDLSHNSADRVQRDIELYSSVAPFGDVVFDNTGAIPQFTPSLSYTNPSTIQFRDQTGWSALGPVAQAGYYKGPTVKDTINSIKLSAKRDLAEGSMFSNVDFGINFTDRKKTRDADEALIGSKVLDSNGNGTLRFNYDANSPIITNVGGTGFSFLGINPLPSNLPAGAALTPKYADDILSKSFGISEKVTTGYVKLDIETEAAGIPLRGNVGAQYILTNQSSSGFQAAVSGNQTTRPVGGVTTAGTTYNDFLPSLNLTADIGSGQAVRLGLAKEMSRPQLVDMRNSFAVAFNSTPPAVNNVAQSPRWEGSAGNPALQPFRASAIDISYEKYFGKKQGYVQAALFYKKLDSYILTGTNTSFDFTPYLAGLGLASNTGPAGNTGILTQQVNGTGGSLKGAELSASIPFNLFTPMLDGFGAVASYSYTTSSVQLPNLIGRTPNQGANGGGNIPLPGLSKNNSKLQLYYDNHGFTVFYAINVRSKYVSNVAGTAVGGFPQLFYVAGQRWNSAQIGYEFQNGFAKGLGLRVEGNNLNSPTYRTLNADGSTAFSSTTGRTLLFGLNYKLQ